MKYRVLYCMAALALTFCSEAAVANPFDSNTYTFSFGQDVFTARPGETVDVPVYFQETVGPPGNSVLVPGGVGLVGAGVRVVFSDPPQPTQPSCVLGVSDIVPNPSFDVPTPSLSLGAAGLELARLASGTVTGAEYSPGVYRVLLGTFRFTAGEVGGESTPIRAADFDPGFDDFVTGDLNVLDGSPISEAQAKITVVPEPGSLLLLIAVALTGVACVIRHSNRPN
jgi:hypothetical protein